MKPVIYITQTKINHQLFNKLVFSVFKETGQIPFSSQLQKLDPKSTEINNLNLDNQSNLLKSPVFLDKNDLRTFLNTISVHRSQPELLFFGDLSNLSTAFQEGLLAFLENPPQNLYIFLTANSGQDILATIKSRSRLEFLEQKLVYTLIEPEIKLTSEKNLMEITKAAKLILTDQNLEFTNLTKVERAEIDFWLWSLEVYLSQYYLKNQSPKVAEKIDRVIKARIMNKQNLQKKFVLGYI